MSTIPLLDCDLAGPEATRRKGRPVDWPGTPRSKEDLERSRINKRLHAVGAEYGLAHEDLSDLLDCSLAIAHIDEMTHHIEQIPKWDAASKDDKHGSRASEWSVASGLIAHMESARNKQEVEQSWKLYSRLFPAWNKLTQFRACKAKKLALWRVDHE